MAQREPIAPIFRATDRDRWFPTAVAEVVAYASHDAVTVSVLRVQGESSSHVLHDFPCSDRSECCRQVEAWLSGVGQMLNDDASEPRVHAWAQQLAWRIIDGMPPASGR